MSLIMLLNSEQHPPPMLVWRISWVGTHSILQFHNMCFKMSARDQHETSFLKSLKGIWNTSSGGKGWHLASPSSRSSSPGLVGQTNSFIGTSDPQESLVLVCPWNSTTIYICHLHLNICCRESSSCQHRWSAEVRCVVDRAGCHRQGCAGAYDAWGTTPSFGFVF